ncbi:MAG: patatin-like phospholipase family protein [Deltaproteobacteria bacterium]|jgi:NTE family protein|nr:patatin-like phospholipase family protein [Deltaproteobacteria bacterium]
MGKRIKLAVTLGGGGARGLAHLGVLKVLERNKIPIDMIVGTSIGALVGAAYATTPDAEALKQRVFEIIESDGDHPKGLKLLSRMQWDDNTKNDWLNRIYRFAQKEVFLSMAMFRNALFSIKEMRDTVEDFVADINIEQTSIPYTALAVDLYTGEQIILNQGRLIEAVMASCAVPGFMPPIPWNGRLLVDGSVANPLPADLIGNIGADVIVAVDVGLTLKQSTSIRDGIDAITRATEIMGYHLSRRGRESADLLIEPAVRQVDWTNFMNYEEVILQGEKAAESQIENIKRLIAHPFRRKLITWTHKFAVSRKRSVLYPSVN